MTNVTTAEIILQSNAAHYLIFGDIEGKLEVLHVECTKCGRKGRYHVHKLIDKYGRKANLMKWKEQLNGDCPRSSHTAPMATEALTRPLRPSPNNG